MTRVMKDAMLNDALAALGIETKIQLFKAMRSSKALSVMVIFRGLFCAGFVWFLLRMAGA